MSPGRAVQQRPAEVAGVGGGGAVGLAYALGASGRLVAVLGIVAGALPAAVTFLVTHGGVRGIFGLVWRGRA